jgi:transposase-like protein
MQSCDRLYDTEIRKVICSANAIESLNARSRRAVLARGRFPNEQAALRCLYPVTRSLDPAGAGRTRWAMRWPRRSTPSPSPSATGSRPPRPAKHSRNNYFP